MQFCALVIEVQPPPCYCDHGTEARAEHKTKPVRHFSANLHHPQLSDFRLQERAKKLAAWDTYRACMVQAVATSSEYWQLAHCEYRSCIVLVSPVHQHTQPLYFYVHSRAIRM